MFAETWQADAYAMTTALIDAEIFTASEWTDTLAAAITAAQRAGDPDHGDTYYQHWLAALENVCAAKLAINPTDVDAREQQWRDAYLRTPHGQPVALQDFQPEAQDAPRLE